MSKANDNSIIFGTGFISHNQNLGGDSFKSKSNKRHCTPKQIISVRGPKSRTKLLNMGLECPKNYGDPLILFPSIYCPKNLTIKNKIGIIPHYIDFDSENVNTLIKNLKKKNFNIKKINIIVGEDYKKFISLLSNRSMGMNVYYKTFFDRFNSLEELNKNIKYNKTIDMHFTHDPLYIKLTPNKQVCRQIVNKTSTTNRHQKNTNGYNKYYKIAENSLKNFTK